MAADESFASRALQIYMGHSVLYTSLQAFFDFAAGCDLPIHIVRRAIEDNDPSDGEVSLGNCVAQALLIWWLSSNRPAIWKSNKVKQGFVKLRMPGIHSCLVKGTLPWTQTQKIITIKMNHKLALVDRCPKSQTSIRLWNT